MNQLERKALEHALSYLHDAPLVEIYKSAQQELAKIKNPDTLMEKILAETLVEIAQHVESAKLQKRQAIEWIKCILDNSNGKP